MDLMKEYGDTLEIASKRIRFGIALMHVLAKERAERDSMVSMVAMIICDTAEALPPDHRQSFWETWDHVKRQYETK